MKKGMKFGLLATLVLALTACGAALLPHKSSAGALPTSASVVPTPLVPVATTPAIPAPLPDLLPSSDGIWGNKGLPPNVDEIRAARVTFVSLQNQLGDAQDHRRLGLAFLNAETTDAAIARLTVAVPAAQYRLNVLMTAARLAGYSYPL